MTQPLIRSSRQYVRLWFEFYKLCLNDRDLENNLEKSQKFYKPWGDVTNVEFDDW